MNKFENVDVLLSLERIMRQNTAFYRTDFAYDKELLTKAAASPDTADKALLWMSRPSGTYCFRECDTFIKDTRQYNTWKFYGEQTHDKILAYAVELTGIEDGTVRGNLYELDYGEHFRHVKNEALPAAAITLYYQYGNREQPADQRFDGYPDPEFGDFLRFETQPSDPDALRRVLQAEKRSREQLTPGDLDAHIAALHDSRIEAEARRVVEEMKRLDAPNSPNKTHFMVELSPHFVESASSMDTDRLFSMLPYKTLNFATLKNRRGSFAIVTKDENRDKDVRLPRPSIRAQLAGDKAKTTPKKAAAKIKTNDLEV